MFKIPLTPSVMSDSENIALRTRSKLSLSDTPLEKIEEAFIPPDITTDMYDLECDDEDWRDFLNRFTKPLEEAVQGQPEDDDEADPEYNVLADEDVRIGENIFIDFFEKEFTCNIFSWGFQLITKNYTKNSAKTRL